MTLEDRLNPDLQSFRSCVFIWGQLPPKAPRLHNRKRKKASGVSEALSHASGIRVEGEAARNGEAEGKEEENTRNKHRHREHDDSEPGNRGADGERAEDGTILVHTPVNLLSFLPPTLWMLRVPMRRLCTLRYSLFSSFSSYAALRFISCFWPWRGHCPYWLCALLSSLSAHTGPSRVLYFRR